MIDYIALIWILAALAIVTLIALHDRKVRRTPPETTVSFDDQVTKVWAPTRGTLAQAVPVAIPAIPDLALGLAPTTRERGWMQTFSGKRFHPLEPVPSEIELVDLAHGLANVCRYAGHTNRFYSVAEHCVWVSHYVELAAHQSGLSAATCKAYAREALLHDSAESYIGDMIRPLKHQPEMLEFRLAEARIESAVFERFGIKSTPASHEAIKSVDDRILRDEIDTLKADPTMYADLVTLAPLGVQLQCWSPAVAKQEFLARYRELFA